MAKHRKVIIARPIKTVFYIGRSNQEVRVTRSKWANSAVPNAVKHMQLGQYDATHCEVYDISTGDLHAVIKKSIGQNKIEILYKRTVKEGM